MELEHSVPLHAENGVETAHVMVVFSKAIFATFVHSGGSLYCWLQSYLESLFRAVAGDLWRACRRVLKREAS